MFGKRTLILGSIILVSLVVPVLAQQSPWGQTGSFLNGTPKPLTFTPIKLPKTPPPTSVTPAAQPKTSIFSKIYPKISLGNWPFKSASNP
jgi:hypothetical protein